MSEDAKADLAKAYPPHELEARRNGTPTLGSGKIYPIDEDQIVVADFAIPAHFKRAYGLDVGWNRTAAIFGALDEDLDILYLYSEHYAGEAIPAIHAESIKARGAWIPGVIDPAARGRSQVDGTQLVELYRAQGLDLDYADNSVSAGIYACWQRMVSGRLKVCASLGALRAEMKLYRRDQDGKIVKVKDHACDAMRYLVMSGLARAIATPVAPQPLEDEYSGNNYSGTGWMS